MEYLHRLWKFPAEELICVAECLRELTWREKKAATEKKKIPPVIDPIPFKQKIRKLARKYKALSKEERKLANRARRRFRAYNCTRKRQGKPKRVGRPSILPNKVSYHPPRLAMVGQLADYLHCKEIIWSEYPIIPRFIPKDFPGFDQPPPRHPPNSAYAKAYRIFNHAMGMREGFTPVPEGFNYDQAFEDRRFRFMHWICSLKRYQTLDEAPEKEYKDDEYQDCIIYYDRRGLPTSLWKKGEAEERCKALRELVILEREQNKLNEKAKKINLEINLENILIDNAKSESMMEATNSDKPGPSTKQLEKQIAPSAKQLEQKEKHREADANRRLYKSKRKMAHRETAAKARAKHKLCLINENNTESTKEEASNAATKVTGMEISQGVQNYVSKGEINVKGETMAINKEENKGGSTSEGEDYSRLMLTEIELALIGVHGRDDYPEIVIVDTKRKEIKTPYKLECDESFAKIVAKLISLKNN
jgi:hypothetical protein